MARAARSTGLRSLLQPARPPLEQERICMRRAEGHATSPPPSLGTPFSRMAFFLASPQLRRGAAGESRHSAIHRSPRHVTISRTSRPSFHRQPLPAGFSLDKTSLQEQISLQATGLKRDLLHREKPLVAPRAIPTSRVGPYHLSEIQFWRRLHWKLLLAFLVRANARKKL